MLQSHPPDPSCQVPYAPQDDALVIWKQGHTHPPPTGSASHLQKEWDSPKIEATNEALLENSEGIARARLLAAMAKESGAWLGAMRISSVGLRLDDDTIRVAVGLRIGASLHVQSAFMLPLWGTGRPLRHSRSELLLHGVNVAIPVMCQ